MIVNIGFLVKSLARNKTEILGGLDSIASIETIKY